jgi:hypothetical protein
MRELEATWERIIRIWWLLAWRVFLGTLLFHLIAGAVAAFISHAGYLPEETAIFITVLIAWLASIYWGLIVVRAALRKKYMEFRLVLVSHTSN